jgi:glycerol kinase
VEKKYILSIDQGTTSSRCTVFDRNGGMVSDARKEFRQIYPKAGWVEHNPAEILSSQLDAIKKAVKDGQINVGEIAALGITNQRETTVVWDKLTGEPVHNAIVWQCRRTADYCRNLKAEGYGDTIYQSTGLVVDSYFSATKIKWILDNVHGARERAEKGDLLFGTVDTYLLWHLSGRRVHATDYSNASRTMLFNIHTRKWDARLLNKFNIPELMLPEVHSSGHIFGYVDDKILAGKIPIAALAGDQQASVFGHLCVAEGAVKNTYGTGCFMLMNAGSRAVRSKSGLLTTLSAGLDGGRYLLEGSVFVGGAIVQWLRDGLQIIKTAAETEEIAQSVKDTNGVYVVPAFVGLGAPYWDPYARGIITGLTGGVRREHIVRAALEAIAFQSADVLRVMEIDFGSRVSRVSVDGGASANNFLMQFQADIFNVTVERPAMVEATALGVAYLAGLSAGFYKSIEEIEAIPAKKDYFEPKMSKSKRDELISGWAAAVRKARCGTE